MKRSFTGLNALALATSLLSLPSAAQVNEDSWFYNNNNLTLPPTLDVGTIYSLKNTKHQIAKPRGVNPGYDWYSTSVEHASLTPPAGFSAFIGWGQVFWNDDLPRDDGVQSNQALEIRDPVTLACKHVNGKFRWYRMPVKATSGSAFRPDFAGNQTRPFDRLAIAPGYLRYSFGTDAAFHFFPSTRELIGDYTCGMVYAFRARAVHKDGTTLGVDEISGMVVGGGADYWRDMNAEWVGTAPYNNTSIGIGRLRALTGTWRWYGFTSASWAALYELDRAGFSLP